MNWPIPLLSALLLFSLSFSSAKNPPTSVLELNDKFLDVMNDGFWFVEFYAPWCAHCKRLHPVWDQVGHALADKNLQIRAAKLDCTRFPSVATSLSINGYPTIAFFRNGRRIDYRGGREKESLIKFATKCASPVVEPISENQLQKVRMESRTDPSFVLFGDNDDKTREAFNAAAESLFSVSRFYTVKSKEQTDKNRIAVLKENAEFEFEDDIEDLHDWMSRERWPSFVAASAANIADIANSGKMIVLVVSSQMNRFNDSSSVGQFHKVAIEAVDGLRKDKQLWKRFQFAWLDGSDIASQIQMRKVEGPQLFVFNYTSYEYYLSEDEFSEMTSKSIVTFLQQLSNSIDKGTAVAFGGRDLTVRIQRMIFEVYWNVAQMFATQPLLSSCLFGVPIAFLSIICYSICSADFSVDRDEFYPNEDEDGSDGMEDEMDGEEDVDEDHEKRE